MADTDKIADPELEEGEEIEGGAQLPKKDEQFDDEGGKTGDEEDVPIRKSANASFIIQRQKDTIEKLRKGKIDEGGEGEELTPEARGLVEKEIDRHIAPIRNILVSKADEDELSNLFENEPEAKTYEKKIRAYMKHEHYQGVPPSVIYHHLAFGEAETTGANKKRIADKEGKMSRTSGNQKRSTSKESAGELPSGEDIGDMSDEEFEALQHDVRQGKYLSKEE